MAAGLAAYDDETRESARDLEEFVRREKKPKAKTIADGAWGKALSWAEEAMRTGDWGDAAPRHYVAAYALLHERTYGVAPAELTPTTRLHAAGMAANLLRREFDGEPGEMAAFLRWTWQREKERETWRRANGRDGGRIGYRLQFTGGLLTDYRVAKARRAGR